MLRTFLPFTVFYFDKILKLLTPLGYPVIYGEKHIYHLYKKNTIKIINRKDLPKKMTNSEIEDTFYKFFDKTGDGECFGA